MAIEPVKSRLGARLKELRGDRPQREIADAVGLSRERMTQLEGGRKSWPDPGVFNSLARTLEVPVTDLLRAAGAAIPQSRDEDLDWLAENLTDEGLALLVDLGRALLPHHRRRPGTAE